MRGDTALSFVVLALCVTTVAGGDRRTVDVAGGRGGKRGAAEMLVNGYLRWCLPTAVDPLPSPAANDACFVVDRVIQPSSRHDGHHARVYGRAR